ncbi:polymorphic toxin type 44 domain-containing protein [Catenovulum maritimum]|uniref:Bacterial toxin 44 domain-containing protein n=1 Tax=Catenovulum maritimum TaxID=1513271 RepID=A0A0J8GT12_9ALTE|nr:polymorphic toxin type 44 domain-containing protein [Catenovulum maritimum]KMT64429.1 hypothetical protein XM47_14115 [Catenovulum maritimum]
MEYSHFAHGTALSTERTFPSKFNDVIKKLNIDLNANAALAKTMTLDQFIKAVRTRGGWDYKNHPDLVKHGLSQSLMEEFGNVHFGYVAAARGLSLAQTLLGGGIYQSFVQGGGYPKELDINALSLSNSEARLATEFGYSWGDNEGDAYKVMTGWEAYNASN